MTPAAPAPERKVIGENGYAQELERRVFTLESRLGALHPAVTEEALATALRGFKVQDYQDESARVSITNYDANNIAKFVIDRLQATAPAQEPHEAPPPTEPAQPMTIEEFERDFDNVRSNLAVQDEKACPRSYEIALAWHDAYAALAPTIRAQQGAEGRVTRDQLRQEIIATLTSDRWHVRAGDEPFDLAAYIYHRYEDSAGGYWQVEIKPELAEIIADVLTHPDALSRCSAQPTAPAVTAQYAATGISPDHPEFKCEKCGVENVIWFTTNDLWNAVDQPHGVLCPCCFVKLAEAAGFNKRAWLLVTEDSNADEAQRVREDKTLERLLNGMTDRALAAERRLVEQATAPAPLDEEKVATVINEIAAERRRQISAEGWTPGHDDSEHFDGQLAVAAGCYAIHAGGRMDLTLRGDEYIPRGWPLYWKFNPKNPRRDLIRAAALIVAEVERLDRLTAIRENRLS